MLFFYLAVFLRKTCIVQPLARHSAPFSRGPLRDFIIPNMRCFFVFYVCWKRFCFIILMLYICDIKYNIYGNNSIGQKTDGIQVKKGLA